MKWLENTRVGIEKLDRDRIVVLPIGSCEQHYTHLPVGTDTFIGEHILKALGQALKDELILLPYIWFGFSQHHMDFAGSLTISNVTLTQLVVDLCTSIYQNGFTKILLFNSHGGNSPALQVAVNELGVRNDRSPILISYWNFLSNGISKIRKSDLGGIGHAGELETSLAMYLFAQYMGEMTADSSYNSNAYLTYDMFSGKSYYTYRKFSEMVKGGLIGDPGLASEETGKQLFDVIVTRLADFLRYYYKNEL